MTAPPPIGWVRITTDDPQLSLNARLSGERPTVAGFGGWQQIARPRRPPLTTWQAQPGLTLTLPILFDGFRSGDSVERQIARLEQMQQPGGADGQPPLVKVVARGGAVPHQEKSWVIGDLAYGDAEMNAAGNRTRQQVTLTLLQYVPVKYLGNSKALAHRAKHHRHAKGAKKKRIRARHKPSATTHTRSAEIAVEGDGEDLLTIAARELGDADRWVEIAEMNGIRDPRSIETGQVIWLP